MFVETLSLYNYWRPNLIASLPNAFFLKNKFNELLKENIDVVSSVPSCIELSVSVPFKSNLDINKNI